MSKSTANYDRGDKFFFYKQIESLEEYILIEQEKPQINIYKKHETLWGISRVEGIESQLNILSLGIEIALKEIYDSVF